MLRVYGLTGESPTVARLRVHELAGTGSEVTPRHLRVHGLSGDGGSYANIGVYLDGDTHYGVIAAYHGGEIHYPWTHDPEPQPDPTLGYDIIVPIIQSNARGAATDYVAAGIDAYPADVYMWDWASGSIVPAVEPIPHLDTGSPGGMGIGNTFAKAYRADRPDRKVLIVNCGHGGTALTTPSTNVKGPNYCWDRALADGPENLALRTVEQLNSIIETAGPGSKIVAFLANHGSTDGTNNTPKATFKALLQDWITWFRPQVGADEVPYLMMQMRPNLVANETRHRIIDEAQAETASELAHVGYTTSPVGETFYKNDSVHFNAAGVREIGTRLYGIYAETVIT